MPKLVGLLCVRNEAWILACSMRAALRWVDELVVVDHNSSDGTKEIIGLVSAEHPWRVHSSHWVPTEEKVLTSRYEGSRTILNPTPPMSWKAQVPSKDESRWDEQDMRQHALLLGRKHGGTHFAMIDADEILTANLLPRVRQDVMALQPGEVLDYPLYAARTLDEYQDDDTHWSRGWMSLAFADTLDLTWKPAADGYHFHSRCPWGVTKRITPVEWRAGGVLHLQFANRRRLVAKHRWYRMVEHIRYPGRMNVAQLNEKYDDALQPPKSMSPIPSSWWEGYNRSVIQLNGWPWHEGEVHRMIAQHGEAAFAGLDLSFYTPPRPPAAPSVSKPRENAVAARTPTREREIAKMTCSDCGDSYFAEIVERGGRYEIGDRVNPPADLSKVRNQRMLCGGCQGKGGPGDQLNNILRRQRGGLSL